MARTRTTKKLAQRIDLNYFKRPTPLKRAKFWLSVLVPVAALVWISSLIFTRDSRVYSSGRLSEPHAVLEKECMACHIQQAGVFSAKAADNACLSCHDGPQHHSVNLIAGKELACAQCHAEHRGRVNISAASNQSCSQCHGDLHSSGGFSHFASQIRSFEDGHPEFAAVRNAARDMSTIKLNHTIHMKPIRSAPNGPMVQLECSDCHRPAAVPAPTTYSDVKYVGAKVSYTESTAPVPRAEDILTKRHPPTGREFMAPVKFGSACAGCHLLTFDKRFEFGVPHDEPSVVRAFMMKKFQEYSAAHPSELRVVRDPGRDLTGKPVAPEFRLLTPAQWVEERTADAEELLWRKTCVQCHSLSMRFEGRPEDLTKSAPWLRAPSETNSGLKVLPEITPALTTQRWMPHAKFDHDAHRGFTCESCHAKALTSTETSDILLPGIATCQTCHAPGPDHAESRCFECHTYHDWSKRKEVTPKFTLLALPTGGGR